MLMMLYMNLMEKSSAVKGENLNFSFTVRVVKQTRLGCVGVWGTFLSTVDLLHSLCG